MTKQRKQYSKEFKLEMVKPIEEQNQRVVDIAKQICFNGALYSPYALNGLTTGCSGQSAARPAAEPER